MGSSIFPSLPGITFPVQRTPVFSTTTQTAISGRETRIALQSFPRWKWELSFSLLRSAAVFTEFQQLAGFFNSLLGSFDSFLYQDADDNAIAGQVLGIADGSTKTFQLVRALGGLIEPMLAPNVVSAVYIAGFSFPSTGIPASVNGALTSTTAGALGATTYYVRTTLNTLAGETSPSPETTLVVAANKVLNIAAPTGVTAGAASWNAYVSNTAGGGSGAETLQASGISLGSPWVEPTSGLIVGAAPPVSNKSGWAVSNWGSASPGVITFTTAPLNSYQITADFSYYWPCRMSDDSLPFSMFLSGCYEAKKVSFISVKN